MLFVSAGVTTPIVPDSCGTDCNKTIVIDSTSPDEVHFWNSANWDTSNYPDDCTCTLTVQVCYL